MMKSFCMIKIIALFLLAITVTGCSSKQVPDGFPTKLVKFSLTFSHEGKPVKGISVWLYPENNSNAKYAATGTTDETGTATPKTTINTYAKSGVPVGTFVVSATHYPEVPPELYPEGWAGNHDPSLELLMKYKAVHDKLKVIPEKWNNIQTSPLKITVPENGGSVTIEITDSKTFVQ